MTSDCGANSANIHRRIFTTFQLLMSNTSLRRTGLLVTLTTLILLFSVSRLQIDSDSHLHRYSRHQSGVTLPKPSQLCPCDITMLIVVLTATRHRSLDRLLASLSSNDYGCCVVDIQINVDMPQPLPGATFDLDDHRRCLDVATRLHWPNGRHTVFRRLRNVGLSQSWFEATYSSEGYDYISIVEDDMQVSPSFFEVFATLHEHGTFARRSVSAFCLHPSDWEVKVDISCGKHEFSKILYESPEPCNWGPIWKYSAWREYVDWVFSMKESGHLPYVPESVSYNFNKYLRDGKDVQSSWVWRYNYDHGMRQVRYSFAKCLRTSEIFLAVNHKEPGQHFKAKLDLQNDPALLSFDLGTTLEVLTRQYSLVPYPFSKYEKGAKSMRGFR